MPTRSRAKSRPGNTNATPSRPPSIGAFQSLMHARNLHDSIHHFQRDGVLEGLQEKESEATAWLNPMAACGYRFVALTSSPLSLSQPCSTITIAHSLTCVVATTETAGSSVL